MRSSASVPEQTLSLRAGLIFESGWESYASIKYIDEMCIVVGCMDALQILIELKVCYVDFVSHYALSDS